LIWLRCKFPGQLCKAINIFEFQLMWDERIWDL